MNEHQVYPQITAELKKLLETQSSEVYLETSADNGFSFDLMVHLWAGPVSLLTTLKKRHGRPDIAGFVQQKRRKDIVMGEVKASSITVNDIYQLRKYVDLFDARYAFLVTTQPISEQMKALIKYTPRVLPSDPGKVFTIGHFDPISTMFLEWYPQKPF